MSRRRASRGRGAVVAISVACGWAALTAAVSAVPGCYGRQCEPSFFAFDLDAGGGRMLDENTWESSPMDGHWIPYPGNRVVSFHVPALGDRIPALILPYISPVEAPYAPGSPPSNATLASGNLIEIIGVGKDRFSLRNGSCAEYALRVVVMLDPRPSPAAPLPPPAEADAAVAPDDAGSDASGPTDAGADGEAGP